MDTEIGMLAANHRTSGGIPRSADASYLACSKLFPPANGLGRMTPTWSAADSFGRHANERRAHVRLTWSWGSAQVRVATGCQPPRSGAEIRPKAPALLGLLSRPVFHCAH